MIFRQLNEDACKTYLLANEKTREAVLIDPVIIYTDKYLELIKNENYNLTYIFDTHTHADHITAAPSLVDETGCEYVMCSAAPAGCVTTKVNEGDIIKAVGTEFRFISTPGHTKDSMSIISENRFFTGDFLFLDDGGAGRDDLPGGDPSDHWESFQKLNNLPDDLMVYPAHDYRDRKPSELGYQKKNNPHLKAKSKSEFVAYINDLKLGPADWMHDVLKANVNCTRDPDAVFIPKDSSACEVMGTLDPELDNIEVGSINAKELKTIIDAGNPVTMIDVREPYELNDNLGHIEGVINIPIGGLLKHLNKIGDEKDQKIVMVCRSGSRADHGAKELVKAGYKDVKVLSDGMIAYRSAGF